MIIRDTCVIYQYYEKNSFYRENFLHFLVFAYSPDVDFYIILCGEHTVELPLLPNYHYIKTNNYNRDFGSFSVALTYVIDIKKYEFFIFLNCSVRGPYLPAYVQSSWTSFFKRPLMNDVKLFGATINILSSENFVSTEFKSRHGGDEIFSHVQTMSFSMKLETIQFLKDINFFVPRAPLHDIYVVTDYEILLSQLMIRNGWNFKCLLPEYNAIDYRKPHVDVNPMSQLGDMLFEGAYFGRTVHPFEVIFAKTNRNLYPNILLKRLSYALAAKNIPLPLNNFNKMINDYVSDIVFRTDFQSELPLRKHQIAAQKLQHIIDAANQILTKPIDDDV